jgi:3-oxoacyl-[acyl-carrier-protein] synthase-1
VRPPSSRRAVITGAGIVSCIGNDLDTVSHALREGRSGIQPAPAYRDMGLRSQVAGRIHLDCEALIDRRIRRFMNDGSMYAYVAMGDAITDAGLDADAVSDLRTGLVVGTGGASPANLIAAADALRDKGVKRIGPYGVTRTMCSNVAATLGTAYKVRGTAYSITSACATSAHCIGHAAERIRAGTEDIMFAGGGEEEHWSSAMLFDAMGALSSAWNDTPECASRPYDAERDGFVIAGGAGIVVVEELEHARRRGARIYAEIVGYGATSDGADMVAPSGEGAVRCMRQALEGVDSPIDYLNTHGTGTPLGDATELRAVREVFGDQMPPISSTKSLTGHSLGAAGVHEAIYCLLMQRDGFLAASAHIDALDPECEWAPVLRQPRLDARPRTVMSNSFGFGGTNGTLVLRTLDA